MRQIMVRYTTRAERAEENARLIREVFAALARTAPAGLRYSSFRLDDGVTFVHIATVEDPARNPLQELVEFKAFTAQISDRCEVGPVTTVLEEVGTYDGKVAS
jgi:hypothetical protein